MYGTFRPRRPGDSLARPFTKRTIDDKLMGVSLYHPSEIVSTSLIDFFKENSVQLGSKIAIMIEGDLLFRMKPRKIPMGQPLYVSHKGKPTWRKVGPRFGYAITHQDKDGFLKVHVKPLISGG